MAKRGMDELEYTASRQELLRLQGYYDLEKDENGFVVLRPTAKKVDDKVASLTTDIEDLETKLKKFRKEKAEAVKYQKTEEYKKSKKASRSKKEKKRRENLVRMVFNNADHEAEEENEEDEGNYKDIKKRGRPRKTEGTTLDTTYGKRFSPVVSMLHDTISDFDRIAAEIEEELSKPSSQGKTMYRSSQFGNLISVKDKKLSAVKELASVAKTLSDLEYKKEKDVRAEEGDTSKEVSRLGAKYLRGVFELEDRKSAKKAKKKDGKKSKKHEEEDDEPEDSVVREKKAEADNDNDLARALAEELIGRGKDIQFTPYERHLDLEGTYDVRVLVDPLDESDWKYVAVDPDSGKELKGDYKSLLPKKKNAKMRFDFTKKKAVDGASGKSYKLIMKN